MRKINEHENLVFWELFVSIKVVNHTHSLKQKMGFMTDSTLLSANTKFTSHHLKTTVLVTLICILVCGVHAEGVK